MFAVLLVVLVACCRQTLCDIASTDNNITSVVGFVGKSVRLACNTELGVETASETEWLDLVYNTGRDPQRIFTSALGLDQTHQNAANFHVDQTDFSLTISGLDLEKDAGQYICRRVVSSGTTLDRSYYLNVVGMPRCSGTVALRPGVSSQLRCEAQYSGILQPVVTWVRDGLTVDSDDEFDIMLARRAVTVPPVSDQDDGVEYTCHVQFGSVVEQCKLQLDVAYLARDIVLAPQKSVVRVGEELRCSARGNPTPEITLTSHASMTDVRHGKGWKSLIIPNAWLGSEMTVTCTATNTVDGATETLTQTALFNITEQVQQPSRGAIEQVQQPSRGAIASSDVRVVAIVAGIVVTVVITLSIIVAFILIRRRNKDDQKPPKGAKPVPTKEEVTLDATSNGHAV